MLSEKEASLTNLSSGWTWNDGQNIDQKYWNNNCLNVPYEPVLRRQAVIGQSYPNGEKLFDFCLKIQNLISYILVSIPHQHLYAMGLHERLFAKTINQGSMSLS